MHPSKDSQCLGGSALDALPLHFEPCQNHKGEVRGMIDKRK